MMLTSNEYNLGDFFYLKTDRDQNKYMVTAIQFSLDNCILYTLNLGTYKSKHYEREMSIEKDLTIV